MRNTTAVRVAIDATPLLGVRTGVATFTGGLLRALAAGGGADPELCGYALSLRGRRRLAGVLPAGVAAVGPPLPAGLLTRLWSRVDAPTAAQLFAAGGPRAGVDVVHGTNYVVPPARSAVVSVYDLTSVRFPHLCAPASRRYPALVRRAVQRGALVHVLAASIGDEVRDLLDVPADRIRVVASGLDAARVTGNATEGHRLAGSPRYVLALGTVEPRKRVEDLVRAFDALASTRRDVALVIAGPDGWDVGPVVAAIDASPHRRRIRRIGWVSSEHRAHLLAGASLLAFPSIYEGFGYPPLEAMAAGTPVVATSAGSLPEVLGDAAVLVRPADVDALAGAIASLLDDDDARSRLAERGRLHAATFTWEACAKGMVDAYRDAAAS